MREMSESSGSWLIQVEAAPVGSYPDSLPAVLVNLSYRGMGKRRRIEWIVVEMPELLGTLVVTADPMGVGAKPQGTVGAFGNGPDE